MAVAIRQRMKGVRAGEGEAVWRKARGGREWDKVTLDRWDRGRETGKTVGLIALYSTARSGRSERNLTQRAFPYIQTANMGRTKTRNDSKIERNGDTSGDTMHGRATQRGHSQLYNHKASSPDQHQ